MSRSGRAESHDCTRTHTDGKGDGILKKYLYNVKKGKDGGHGKISRLVVGFERWFWVILDESPKSSFGHVINKSLFFLLTSSFYDKQLMVVCF